MRWLAVGRKNQDKHTNSKYLVIFKEGEKIMKKLQKGFTLIELLIVIMIIGILSASMALVSNKSTASAKAANIISNLKIMQSAGSLFYFDHIESKDTELTAEALTTASPDYLGQAVKGMAGYGFCTNHPASTAVDKTVKWYA